IPVIAILLRDEVAKCRALIDIANKNVGIVHAADFVGANSFVAQLPVEPVHHLIRFLRDSVLDLHLKNQVCTALQVKTELDLTAEVVLHLRNGRWKRRQSNQKIDGQQNNENNEDNFPL